MTIKKRICEYCGKQVEQSVTMPEHYRSCAEAKNARCEAAIGFALVLEDVESIKNVLSPLVEP